MRSISTLCALLLLAATAAAKDKKTYLPEEIKKVEKRAEGWDGSLVLGASSSLAQNSNVVGATDGIAWAMGAQVTGGVIYLRGQHEWTNTFKLAETYSYTTALDEFVKTVDELSWKSTYLYSLRPIPWLGPFGELKLKTAILPTHDVQSEPYAYVDPAITSGALATDNKFKLSEPFRPLHIEESAGAFGKPIKKDPITVEIKVGFGGKHVFAADQYAVDEVDKDTKEVTLKALDDVHQGGPAASLGAKGSLSDKKVTYFALAEAMIPVINNQAEDEDKSAVELTNVLLEAGITFKLVSWASLDYTFRALREPQLIDKWQIQNNLLLTFSYTLVKARAEEKKAD
jgi:hypothetical protein